MEYLTVTYHLEADLETARDLAAAVLLEQTIETPRTVGRRYPFVSKNLMGSIERLSPVDDGGCEATLRLPAETALADPCQFLNVLFGNSSLHQSVRLVDFAIPSIFESLFAGPQFGIAGLRKLCGVNHRPLTASALKPVGLSVPEVASLSRTFAEGGIDIVKDDHYLANHSFCPFEERVTSCLAAVADVASRTGRASVYAPNLSGTPDQIFRQLDRAQALGAKAVMVAPMLMGLPSFYDLTQHRSDIPVLAHPSFSGTSRIDSSVLLGKLFRLFGADAVIYVNYGGRFSCSRADCLAVAEELRAPWPPYRAAFPVPAGGMSIDRAEELVASFGRDTILLIGGSLLEAGDSLLTRTLAFTRAVELAAVESLAS